MKNDNNNNVNSGETVNQKFQVSYLDGHGNLRQRYITAANERDALVDAWLNNKAIVQPVSVTRI